MQYHQLGATGPRTSALGLGAMGMSGMYGPSDRAESIATLHAALDAGITLIDTGDFYGSGHNEMLIGEALRATSKRDAALLSVKFGGLRDPAGGWTGFDARPAALKNFLAYTLQRLGVDHIDIYRPARLDPAVPIEDTVGAMARLVEQGKVRHLGLSEAGAETIRRAHAVHPIAAVQTEYSLLYRAEAEATRQVTRLLGIGFVGYSPLGRGFLAGAIRELSQIDGRRAAHPRFQEENFAHNRALVDRFEALAAEKGCKPSHLALAWLLAQGDDVVAIPGTRSIARLEENLGALQVALTADDLARLDAAIPAGAAAGTRYPAAGMTSVQI